MCDKQLTSYHTRNTMLKIKQYVNKNSLQTIIVSICIFAVCLGTQQMQTVKWDTGIYEFSRDMLGIVMAIIIGTNYNWCKIQKYKWAYIVWSILGIIAGVFILPVAIRTRLHFLLADTIIIYLGILLMGYCIIYTTVNIIVEKYRPSFFMPLFVIWIIMLCWMIFSKTSFVWPVCYFVLFLCYYLTEQTPLQNINVIKGIINGIILAFIVIQGHSFLTRPYDRLRYYGDFCNPNHNCLFICICLAAILGKIIFLVNEDRNKKVIFLFFLLAGGAYSFIFMTQSMSGALTALVMSIVFLILYCKVRKKRIFIRMGIFLTLIFLIMMPITYLAVRYIPTIHPHVNFYFQEGYSEDRVHSWDPWNSEKYITFEELIESYRARIRKKIYSWEKIRESFLNAQNCDNLKIVSSTAYVPQLVTMNDNRNWTNEGIGDNKKNPLLTKEEEKNSFLVRYTIYKWYFIHLSLRGMPYDEQGFQLTEDHWIQDTHNIYLDYGINFGYPAMILFIVFIWWGIARLWIQGIKTENVRKLVCLFILCVTPIFGMFEFAWGAGMISTVSLYLCSKEVVCN